MARRAGDRVSRIKDDWTRERPDVDVSSIGLIVPVVRLATLVLESRARVLATHDIDQSHLDVLETLRRSGRPYRLTAGELSRRCHVTPGATTQRVAAMERLELVRRIREEPDKRTVHVELTARGVTRLDEIFADVMAGDDSMLDGLTQEQRAMLEQALRAWLDLREA